MSIFLTLGLSCEILIADAELVFARATKYHKTDRNCDPNTRKGITSTKIRLGDNCDRTIGMVAVDPQRIPYGSLIYSPQNKRLYLACNVGGSVSARTAAKRLAKIKGLPKKYFDAIVLDFYAPKEIINNHFDYFLVIKHEGSCFRFTLSKKEQERRLDPLFWIAKVKKVYNNSDFDNPDLIRELLKRLENMPNT